MGLFRSMVTKASAGVPNSGSIPALGAMPTASGMLVSQSTAMAVSAVYACVSIRSEDVARCTPRLFKTKADGSRQEVTNHSLCKLFKKPNRIQTWFEFCEQMGVAYNLRSNAYAAILRDGRGNPSELIPINPDAVMVLEAVDGNIFYNVNRLGLFQLSVLQNFPVAIPAEDIFHLRGPTFNMLAAASKIGLARDSVGLAMAQEQQAARFIGNGARPSGVLESPTKLTTEAAKRLKASWDAFQSGIQNVGRTVVLEEGIKFNALQLTSVDIEFLNSRTFQVSEVARWWRVPLMKLGVAGASSTKITPAEEEQSYVNNTVMPDLCRWEQKFEQVFGLDNQGISCDFDEAQLLRADVMTRYNAGRIGVLSGVLTPNEFRASEGLSPKEGGDNLMVPANTAALGSDMTGTAPDGAGRPAGGNPAAPSVPTSGDQPTADPVSDPEGEL